MTEPAVAAAVGLTGGIGSGKSMAAGMFAGLGVPVLDLDAVGGKLTVKGSEGLLALVSAFGNSILRSNGELDRKALAKRCFGDMDATRRLNAILHPLIWAEAEAWLKNQHSPYVIIEASVLIESGGVDRMDAVVVVMADLDIRRARVLARGRQSKAEFDAIVASQCTDDDRRRLADDVLDNNGDISALRRHIELLHVTLSERFADRLDR
jgi:dephospho-CoA kinase